MRTRSAARTAAWARSPLVRVPRPALSAQPPSRRTGVCRLASVVAAAVAAAAAGRMPTLPRRLWAPRLALPEAKPLAMTPTPAPEARAPGSWAPPVATTRPWTARGPQRPAVPCLSRPTAVATVPGPVMAPRASLAASVRHCSGESSRRDWRVSSMRASWHRRPTAGRRCRVAAARLPGMSGRSLLRCVVVSLYFICQPAQCTFRLDNVNHRAHTLHSICPAWMQCCVQHRATLADITEAELARQSLTVRLAGSTNL